MMRSLLWQRIGKTIHSTSFIQTLTVATGIAPVRPVGSRSLPPVENFTLPWSFILCVISIQRCFAFVKLLVKKGYIKVDGVSSVFCFIWGWEEPAWGLPFQFHGVFYVMISMKGPWYASVIWAQKRSALKPTTALVRSRSLMNNSMICFIASNFNSYSQFDYDADIRSIVLFLVPCPHCSVCSRV